MIAELIPTLELQPQTESFLKQIDCLNQRLEEHFQSKFVLQLALNRQLVSFQANKSRPVYRWYKYKEAFSAALVEHLLEKFHITSGHILDPFAGSGTAMFAASTLGIDADGIELLPIGQQIIATKQILETDFTSRQVEELRDWLKSRPWRTATEGCELLELRITQGAYSPATKESIERYSKAASQASPQVQSVLRFALLCVLEAVSFTRKDGQYLRWDYRSGRKQGATPFDKGLILNFDDAIEHKLTEIIDDLGKSPVQASLFPSDFIAQGNIRLFNGSCLDLMPKFPANTYDAIITSPPYCNRYDYTRTYALELALLGVNEQELLKLRQTMLSCTVENRAKDLLGMNSGWQRAVEIADRQELLQSILAYLENQRQVGELNNSGIPRMVRGYFYEMACVIGESARVLKPNARLFMVNDNVRYAGASISVDMILSSMAEELGFHIESIFVLPNDKGNSSQQMGTHGRQALRKCVYVWRKR